MNNQILPVSECSICYNPIQVDRVYHETLFECVHNLENDFCKSCVLKWKQAKGDQVSCPKCRASPQLKPLKPTCSSNFTDQLFEYQKNNTTGLIPENHSILSCFYYAIKNSRLFHLRMIFDYTEITANQTINGIPAIGVASKHCQSFVVEKLINYGAAMYGILEAIQNHCISVVRKFAQYNYDFYGLSLLQHCYDSGSSIIFAYLLDYLPLPEIMGFFVHNSRNLEFESEVSNIRPYLAIIVNFNKIRIKYSSEIERILNQYQFVVVRDLDLNRYMIRKKKCLNILSCLNWYM